MTPDAVDRTAMTVRLTRPAVAAVETAPKVGDAWTLALDLTDAQADGHGCIRCGERGGPMVPAGTVERPAETLRRLGVPDSARTCQIFAHVECAEVRP